MIEEPLMTAVEPLLSLSTISIIMDDDATSHVLLITEGAQDMAFCIAVLANEANFL
jgi:hypothetical protein